MRAVRALVAVAALVAGARSSALASDEPCAAILPPQVRVLDCRLAAAVAVGLERSPTLRQAFARIADLQGIVYVTTAKYVAVTRKDVRGALSHQVAVSGPVCVLRITMIPDVGDRALGTFAHELRHAIEVLEHPEARSEPAIAALFERIGASSGYGAYETEAAMATQATVLRELEEWRRRNNAVHAGR